jgi:hypothetical protein
VVGYSPHLLPLAPKSHKSTSAKLSEVAFSGEIMGTTQKHDDLMGLYRGFHHQTWFQLQKMVV